MKKLRKGEVRFEVRKVGTLWRVYDRAMGSYPYAKPELGGKIVQDVSQKEAQVEADRLNAKYGPGPGTAAPVVKPSIEDGDTLPTRRTRKKAVPVTSVKPDEIIEFNTPDYGTASEEEAAAYTDGIFEKTVY